MKTLENSETWRQSKQMIESVHAILKLLPASEENNLKLVILDSLKDIPLELGSALNNTEWSLKIPYLKSTLYSIRTLQAKLYLAKDLHYVPTTTLKPVLLDIEILSKMLLLMLSYGTGSFSAQGSKPEPTSWFRSGEIQKVLRARCEVKSGC